MSFLPFMSLYIIIGRYNKGSGLSKSIIQFEPTVG